MSQNNNVITPKQQQAAADEMRKYLLDDCLKPQYNGMTAYEIAGKVLEAGDWAAREEVVPDARTEKENYQDAH